MPIYVCPFWHSALVGSLQIWASRQDNWQKQFCVSWKLSVCECVCVVSLNKCVTQMDSHTLRRKQRAAVDVAEHITDYAHLTASKLSEYYDMTASKPHPLLTTTAYVGFLALLVRVRTTCSQLSQKQLQHQSADCENITLMYLCFTTETLVLVVLCFKGWQASQKNKLAGLTNKQETMIS